LTDLIATQPLETDLETPGLARIIPKDAVLDTIATGFVATEGPVWNRREEYLLWSDMAGDKIYKWKAGEGTSVFVDPSWHSNGLTYDLQGRLIVAGFAARRIWRLEPDGSKTTLADHYDGFKLQAPNDIVVKSDGSIYWTESTGALLHPGLSGPGDLYDVQQYRDHKPVLRLAPDGAGPTSVVDDFEGPNGIAFSPDESVLYIIDIRRRHIRAFDVQQDGTLANSRVFYEDQQKERGNPDGMKVDVEGNVYVRAAGGVQIIDPNGQLLGRIRIPEMTNLAWGEDDWRTLFITGRDNIYRVRLNIPGVPVW
jgi:gluconolactonase